MKKFEGYLDEMRFSDAALYAENFAPPASLARPFLRVQPRPLSFTIVKERGRTATQRITVSAGGLGLDWSASEEIPWMRHHPNAKLTFAGRLLLVDRVMQEDWTVRQAAQAAGISVRRAHVWLSVVMGVPLLL